MAMVERLGRGQRCPHCGATSGVAPDHEGGHRCLVCGGPLIPLAEHVERRGGERATLQRVKSLRAQRTVWMIGAVAAGALGVVSGLAALGIFLVADLGAVTGAALLAFGLAPWALTLFAWRRARARSAEAQSQLKEARRIVAAEVLAARRITPDELARLLCVSPDEGIELAAHAEVLGLTDSVPETRYRVEELGDEELGEAPTERAGKIVR